MFLPLSIKSCPYTDEVSLKLSWTDLKIAHKGVILLIVPLLSQAVIVLLMACLLYIALMRIEQSFTARAILSQAAQIISSFYDATLEVEEVEDSNISSLDHPRAALINRLSAQEQALAKLAVDVKNNRLMSLEALRQKRDFYFQRVARYDDSALQEITLTNILNTTRLGENLLLDARPQLNAPDPNIRKKTAIEVGKKLNNVIKDLQKRTDRLAQKPSFAFLVAFGINPSENSSTLISALRPLLLIGFATWLVLNLLITCGMSWLFSQGIVARLGTLTENALRLASSKKLLPPLAGKDELASLDHDFHRMAEELAQLTRREKAIVENAVDVICCLDAASRFSEVSPSAQQSWHYEPAELIGKTLTEIVEPSQIQTTLSAIAEAKASNKPFVLQNSLITKDGSEIGVLWSGAWSDRDQTLFCVAHDVTERVRLEQLKRQFAAMVSHDLRTPLTSFQCFFEGLTLGLYDQSADGLKKKAQSLEKDVSRLMNMVNSLLELEKMEAGMMTIDCQTFAVATLVERHLEIVAPLAEKKNIRLTSDVCDAFMFADQDLLIQVLVNLLSNAIKFSPENENIEVIAQEHESSIEFKVIDHGRGIPAEYKDKVFDRFQQVELSDARLKGGTGLGLAICKAIVESHHGQIGVESELGMGSTFWFTIPLEQK
jgi:PAS domain S-box-containing protein